MPQKAMKKGLSKEQILRARSGAQISQEEANRFSKAPQAIRGALQAAFERMRSKAGLGAGKAAGSKRRKLPKSLTSEKRGFMTKEGGLALGRGMGRKTGHKERGRIGLRSR